MPFYLYFVRDNLVPVVGGELRKHFKSRPNITLKQQGTGLEIGYSNARTMVEFAFTYDPDGLESAVGREGEAYRASQLSFSIGFLRPSFHMREAVSEIGRLVDNLSLLVLNPQSAKRPDTPDMFVPKEVMMDWRVGNKRAVEAHSKNNGPMPYVDPRASDEVWRYLLAKRYLAEKVDNEVLVPKLSVLFDPGSGTARTAVTFMDAEPIVLPKVGSVLIDRVVRKGFLGIGRKEERGIAKYSVVIEHLKPWLEVVSLKRPVYSALMLSPGKAPEALEAFKKIPIEPIPEALRTVPANAYVDVR